MFKEKHIVLTAALPTSAFSGVGILCPEEHNYNDLFADMYVKVVDYYTSDGKDLYSRISTCKLRQRSSNPESLYFTHNNRRYNLDDFMRVNCW